MAVSINSEEQLQAACFQWFWNTYPDQRRMLFHVQQKAANRIEGARFKAVGVVQGISDLILIGPQAVYFIEMKYGDGVQFAEQKEFQTKVEARGHRYVICRTFDDFTTFVKTVLNLL